MITRWDEFERGFNRMSDLRRRMDRIFGERDMGARVRGVSGWPRAALYDNGSTLVVLAELPGLSEKDLKLTVNRDVLTVEGERRAEAPAGYSVHRQERAAVRFARSFAFPCPVDVEKIAATVKNGMLTITLPKAVEAQPRQIQVRAG